MKFQKNFPSGTIEQNGLPVRTDVKAGGSIQECGANLRQDNIFCDIFSKSDTDKAACRMRAWNAYDDCIANTNR